jgi:hypothetical protein
MQEEQYQQQAKASDGQGTDDDRSGGPQPMRIAARHKMTRMGAAMLVV